MNNLLYIHTTRKFLTALFLLSMSLHAYGQKAKTHTMTADESKVAKKDAGVFFKLRRQVGNAAVMKFIGNVFQA